MAHIYLALGSNIGDKKSHIDLAVTLLGEKISNIDRAHLYRSKAMYHTDQDDFMNTVIGGDTELSPEALLAFVKDIEQRVGREARFQNGPREIDADILFYDDLILEIPSVSGTGGELGLALSLQIPHPRIEERAFVLIPLADIAPDFEHPVLKLDTKTLLGELSLDSLAEVQSLA